MVKKPLLHHLFDLVGPPRVPEPLARPLRPPFLLLLARKHKQSPFTTTLHLDRYRRILTHCDVNTNRKTTTTRKPGSLPSHTTKSMKKNVSSTSTLDRQGDGRGGRVCNKVGSRSGRDGRWPARCGDWLRVFPFNAATLHAGKDAAFLKTGVGELVKYRKTCERVYRAHTPTTPAHTLDREVRACLWRDTVLWCPPR